MDLVTALSPLIPTAYVGIFAAIITTMISICAAIDASVPQPAAGSKWVGVRKVISFVALNFGHATNAIPAGLPASVQSFVKDAAAVTAAAPAIAAVGEQATRLANDIAPSGKL